MRKKCSFCKIDRLREEYNRKEYKKKSNSYCLSCREKLDDIEFRELKKN